MKLNKQLFLLIFTTTALVLLFVFLRIHKLDESFSFQNDAGRDLLTLQDWQETWKPPLLGPQTSFIAFNQSPFYFYLFFPIFILTHSYFTTQYTLVIIYCLLFLIGVYVFRKEFEYLIPLSTSFFLIAIHPQFILQHRFVWNPSFITVFLAASFFIFLALQKNYSRKNIILFGLMLALAVGMSISVAPAVLGYIILSIFIFGKKSWQLLVSFICSLLFVFLPVLFFELKYSFQITRRLFVYSYFSEARAGSLSENATSIYHLLFPIAPASLLLILLFALLCLWHLYHHYKKNRQLRSPNSIAFLLLLISTLLLLIAPFKIEAHYIFAPLTFLLLFIATLPHKYSILISIFLTTLWLQPSQLDSYFRRAPRTVNDIDSCFRQVCSELPQPTFVSNQADFHRFHTAFEFKYAMKKNGCQVKYVEREPDAASHMAVVVDGSNYTHGQTGYDELTLFGESEEIDVIRCSDTLSVHVLQKK